MRLLPSLFTITLFTSVAAGTVAADNTKPKRGRPHQVVPTGADDAAAAAPDAAAEAELEAMTSRSSAGLTPIGRVDGSTMLDLEGRFMSVAVASPGGASCHTGTAVATAAKVKAKKKAKAKARRAPRPAPAPIPTVNGLEVM